MDSLEGVAEMGQDRRKEKQEVGVVSQVGGACWRGGRESYNSPDNANSC